MRRVLQYPERRAPIVQKKPKPWSHQRELEALKGKNIMVVLRSGETLTGKLLEADQFTVKIDQGVGGVFPAVVFKSSVTFFREVN